MKLGIKYLYNEGRLVSFKQPVKNKHCFTSVGKSYFALFLKFFASDWKVLSRKCTQNLFYNCEFHENLLSQCNERSENISICTHKTCCPILNKFNITYLRMRRLRISKFHKIRHMEGRTLSVVVKETFSHSFHNTTWRSESIQRLSKACVPQ